MTILIDGISINVMTVHDIIAGASAVLQPGSASNAYYRNRDLMRLFHNVETINEYVLSTRFGRLYPDRGHSDEFVAFRAAQLICWGVQERLVESIPGDVISWKLIEREPVYEFIGRERDQNAVRTRGWLPAEKEEGEAIWAKELKRRERARLKDEKAKARMLAGGSVS